MADEAIAISSQSGPLAAGVARSSLEAARH